MGCIDFGTAEKSFVVYLGNANNGLAYDTLMQSRSVTSNGFLVRVGNRDVTKFKVNKIDVFTNINANGKYIQNLSPPLHISYIIDFLTTFNDGRRILEETLHQSIVELTRMLHSSCLKSVNLRNCLI